MQRFTAKLAPHVEEKSLASAEKVLHVLQRFMIHFIRLIRDQAGISARHIAARARALASLTVPRSK